jgi:hypothetical protein
MPRIERKDSLVRSPTRQRAHSKPAVALSAYIRVNLRQSAFKKSVSASLLVGVLVLLSGCAMPTADRHHTAGKPAPDSAVDFRTGAAEALTPGGSGGRIVRVTTLAAGGEGSLKSAIELDLPRTIVFEVGGVIDLAGHVLEIRNPNVTIAGQTAPSPGITLIRGGIDVHSHDVIVEHLRVRTGEAGFAKHSGWERDGLSTFNGAANVIVDHCSFAWATDENLSASGKRFTGTTPDEWRAATSHDITYSNNIIAEGLAKSTHGKPGEHSKGTLVHDNVTGVVIVGNLYAHNGQRNALFKGGARGVFVNNVIFDPGQRAVHYNLWASEWGSHPYQTGRLALAGNVLKGGASTDRAIAFFMLGGDGDVELYQADNLATDRDGRLLPMFGRYRNATGKVIGIDKAAAMPAAIEPRAASAVTEAVLAHAGARPWDRDTVDRRLVDEVRSGGGRIVDSEADVGGYPPAAPATRRAFVEAEWDLATMQPRASQH